MSNSDKVDIRLLLSVLMFSVIRRRPRYTLFPYTTLFRSVSDMAKWVLCRLDSGRYAGGRLFSERSEEHTSELQSLTNLVCRLLLEKKKSKVTQMPIQDARQREDTTGPEPTKAPYRTRTVR